jgi:hypothetical protein
MRTLRTLFSFLLAAALTACGGGGEMVARIGSGGSGAPVEVSIGDVGGFGSIIVNGQHFDETSVQFALDERPDRPTPQSVAAVRLGMQLQFEHQGTRMTRATAAAEVIGPVASVSTAALEVMGQTVRVNADAASPTIFDGFTSLAELAGAVVEVHGQRNAAGEIQATRIQQRPAGSVLRVAGTVKGFANGAFQIGALTIRVAQAAIVPGGQSVSDGQRVAVWTDQPLVSGELTARVIRIGGPAIPADAALTVEGLVSDVQGSTVRLAGVAVDVGAAQWVGGTLADLRVGRLARATGIYSANVLRATRVELLTTSAARIELTGAVTGYVGATSAFRVRETAVRVTSQTTYLRGDASNLGDGVLVKIGGPVVNGVVEATTLEFLPPSAGIARVLFGTVSEIADITGGRRFVLSPLPLSVETTPATTFKKGVASDLGNGRGVKVDGSYDGLRFLATEIQFMDNVSDPPTFSLDGIASNVQPATLVVDGKTVNLTPLTVYTPAPSALKNGVNVSIEAVKINGQLYASSVEVKDAASGTTSVRGVVSGRADDTVMEFLVGAQRVSVAGNPQVVPGNKSLKDIRNGTDLEVEGTIASGLLTATKVRFR